MLVSFLANREMQDATEDADLLLEDFQSRRRRLETALLPIKHNVLNVTRETITALPNALQTVSP